MPELDKVELALKEIGFCQELKVNVANGVIVSICKGRYQRPGKHGVETEITLKEDIGK